MRKLHVSSVLLKKKKFTSMNMLDLGELFCSKKIAEKKGVNFHRSGTLSIRQCYQGCDGIIFSGFIEIKITRGVYKNLIR